MSSAFASVSGRKLFFKSLVTLMAERAMAGIASRGTFNSDNFCGTPQSRESCDKKSTPCSAVVNAEPLRSTPRAVEISA